MSDDAFVTRISGQLKKASEGLDCLPPYNPLVPIWQAQKEAAELYGAGTSFSLEDDMKRGAGTWVVCRDGKRLETRPASRVLKNGRRNWYVPRFPTSVRSCGPCPEGSTSMPTPAEAHP